MTEVIVSKSNPKKENITPPKESISPPDKKQKTESSPKPRKILTGLDQYRPIEKLGEGTYGNVTKARDLNDPEGGTVAIKMIKLVAGDEGISASTMREISLLKHLQHHPNVINMHKWILSGEFPDIKAWLVFECLEFDLREYITRMRESEQFMPLTQIKTSIYQIIEAVRFCHSRRILHRDIKPANILISATGVLKLADFGLGREVRYPNNEITNEVVSLWYRPPEILLGSQTYATACDIFGCGCILPEIATNVPLFTGTCDVGQIYEIMKIMGTPTEEDWPGMTEYPGYNRKALKKFPKMDLHKYLEERLDEEGIILVEKMLAWDPNQRLSAQAILMDSWFDDVREDMIEFYGWDNIPHCGSVEYQNMKYNTNLNKAQTEETTDQAEDSPKK